MHPRPSVRAARSAGIVSLLITTPAIVGLADLPDLGGDAAVSEPAPGRVLVVAPHGLRTSHAITGWALERGHELRGFEVTQPSLEDVYLRLTENENALEATR